MQRTRRGPLLWFALSILALASVFAALTLASRSCRTPVWRLVALTVAAAIPYLSALWAAKRIQPLLLAGWPVVALSLALRLILVPAPPVFSDDIYRYVWDGRVSVEGLNPYRFAPDSPAVAALRNADWQGINHKSLKTIYPPLGQLLFLGLALIAPFPAAFKLASTLADGIVVCLMIWLAGGRIRSPNRIAQPGAARAAWLGLVYGLNPLACVETGMSGHLEPFGIGLALGALLLVVRKRRVAAAALLGLGACVKLLPVLLLPAVAGRRLRAWAVFALLVAALYLPFASAGLALVETLDVFARRWEGNAGLFAVVKSVMQTAIGSLGGVDRPEAILRLPFLDPLARALQNTFFSLHKDGAYDPAAPGAFALQDLSLAASKILLSAVLVAVVVKTAGQKFDPVTAALWIMGAVVVVTPVMHPWYLLWVLPIAALRAVWPFYLLGLLAPLSYLPLDAWWRIGIWRSPAWISWLEYGLFGLAFAVYLIGQQRGETGSGP